MKKTPFLILFLMLLACTAFGAVPAAASDPAADRGRTEGMEPVKIRVLILPKFEVGEMKGDFPGEAQCYFEHYLDGGEAYDIPGCEGSSSLYVKDGAALCVLGMGKVRAALNTMAILSDSRFDFSDAYIISVGCAGSAKEYSVMGDVCIITAAVDYDLGHHADARDLAGSPDVPAATWFHIPEHDDTAVVFLNPQLTDWVYGLVRDVKLETTDRTRNYMEAAFDGAEWALRDPKVLKGTTATGDNYWKGEYDHANAVLMTKTYGCPDPFALTEMEDIGVASAVKHMGLLDRFLIIRDSVNMDVFMLGSTPESLWDPDSEASGTADTSEVETADIFETAMKNNFEVGRVVIDAFLSGQDCR